MQYHYELGPRLRATVFASLATVGLILPVAAAAQQGNYSTAYQGTAYSNTAPTQPSYETRSYSYQSYQESRPQMARAQSCMDPRSRGGCDMAEQKAKAANYLLADFPREQCEGFVNNGKLRSYNACQQ